MTSPRSRRPAAHAEGETRSGASLRLAAAVAAVVAVVGLLVAGCGGGSSSEASPPPASPSSPTSSSTEPLTDSPTPESTSPAPSTAPASNSDGDDGKETLADAGVSAALARQLVARANALGYGPADKSFAWVMVAACRDVKAGATTFAEMVDQDIADGAPRSDATQMYAWLKSSFCPHVKPPADQKQTKASGPGTPPPGLQALGASVSVFDAKWKASSQAPCRAASGTPLGKARAYAFSSTTGVKATICLDYLGRDPLGDVQDSLSVVYATPVSTETALADLGKLLPVDATEVNRVTGHNPAYAAHAGSCLSVLYSSRVWHARMRQYDSDEDFGITYGTKLTAVLYSGRQTSNGSSMLFNGTVRFADLGSGGHNFGYKSSKVTC